MYLDPYGPPDHDWGLWEAPLRCSPFASDARVFRSCLCVIELRPAQGLALDDPRSSVRAGARPEGGWTELPRQYRYRGE